VSIYGSLPAPDDDYHEDDCARWEKRGDIWDIGDKPCDCGQVGAPLVYQGSHVLPSEEDRRGGHVDLGLISPHVRFWRDNPDASVEDEPDIDTALCEPFLRFGVNDATVVLTRRNVEEVYQSLLWWLKNTEPATAGDSKGQ
jgi:hypothetical protein